MNEKCKCCAHPSKGCIPFLMSLSTPELREWCRVWKERLKLSNAQLADKSGVPKGTVDRIMGHGDVGISLTTIRLLISGLTGCSLAELAACTGENIEGAEELRQLREENQQLKHELAQIEKLERKHEAILDRIERHLATYKYIIIALLAACAALVFTLIY